MCVWLLAREDDVAASDRPFRAQPNRYYSGLEYVWLVVLARLVANLLVINDEGKNKLVGGLFSLSSSFFL
jgi:hypothetical protein